MATEEDGHVPTDSEPVPTDTEPVPTDTEPVPTDSEPVPTDSEPVPTDSEPAPTDSEPSLTDSEAVPRNSEAMGTGGQFTSAVRWARGRGAVIALLRIVLAGILVYAGALKVQDTTAFAQEVAGYQLFPQLSPLIATTLPTVELVLGFALLAFPRRSPWFPAAALATTATFAVFLVGVVQVVARGIDTRCGCFGKASGMVDHLAILRVLSLASASAVLLWLTWPASAARPTLRQPFRA